MSRTENFYQNIKSFKQFSSIASELHFVSAPDDWYVVIADVKGSTRAIQEGRYKQVNMIGAACITCILNCIKDYDFPFMFGGDGATALIPPQAFASVKSQLSALQSISKNDFQLELRVGFVPVNLLYKEGCKLKVGKYELSPGNYLAQFRGNALGKAEDMVKKAMSGAILLNENAEQGSPNLKGLSCRLNPLPTKNGLVLSLLCRPRLEGQLDRIVEEVLSGLQNILMGDLKVASPVSEDRLAWRWVPRTLNEESLLQKRERPLWLQKLRSLLWSLASNGSLKLNYALGPFKPQKYKTELVLNSDYHKFDETLRMVIDCSREQATKIEELLEKLYKQGKVFYGLHRSTESLMTCMVYSASQNQHVHFIDGSDGGYAMAAIGLKKQMTVAVPT